MMSMCRVFSCVVFLFYYFFFCFSRSFSCFFKWGQFSVISFCLNFCLYEICWNNYLLCLEGVSLSGSFPMQSAYALWLWWEAGYNMNTSHIFPLDLLAAATLVGSGTKMKLLEPDINWSFSLSLPYHGWGLHPKFLWQKPWVSGLSWLCSLRVWTFPPPNSGTLAPKVVISQEGTVCTLGIWQVSDCGGSASFRSRGGFWHGMYLSARNIYLHITQMLLQVWASSFLKAEFFPRSQLNLLFLQCGTVI